MAGREKIGNAPSGENSSLAGTEKVPVSGSQYTLISTIASYIRTLTQTLTNKTIDLASNTLTGTKAQFNTAMSDADFATLTGAETLTNKTLTAPVVADFTNAAHDHGDADDGGSLAANITLTTPTIASFTNATHNHEAASGGGTLDEDALALTDVATNNSSTTKHGFLKKLSNVSTEFMNGQGNWATPAGGGSVATDAIFDTKGDLAVGTGADTAAKLAAGANGLVLVTDSTQATGLKWDSVAGTGDVIGPASATDNAISRFDSTTGKLIQNSAATVDDSGTVNIPTGQTYNINGVAHTHAGGGAVATDTIWDAKGDLAGGTGADTAAKLTVGANDKVLTAASGETTGLKWSYPPGFELDYVEFTSNVSPTATTEGTANTVVTGNSVAYDGSTIVLIEFFANNARPATDAAGRSLTLWLYEDGSSIGQIGLIATPAASTSTSVINCARRITPSNASHTYSIRASVSGGTGLVAAGAGGAGNTAPGYIRITKVNP